MTPLAEVTPLGELPVAITGLGVVITLAGLFVKAMTKDRGAGFDLAEERQQDITGLRTELEIQRKEASDQRRLKHEAMNLSASRGAQLSVVKLMGSRCTCGAWTQIQEYLNMPSQQGDQR